MCIKYRTFRYSLNANGSDLYYLEFLENSPKENRLILIRMHGSVLYFIYFGVILNEFINFPSKKKHGNVLCANSASSY